MRTARRAVSAENQSAKLRTCTLHVVHSNCVTPACSTGEVSHGQHSVHSKFVVATKSFASGCPVPIQSSSFRHFVIILR